MSRGNRGISMVSIVLVGVIILVLGAIAVPNFQKARVCDPLRRCFANQKTIAGGLEMYALDKNLKESPPLKPDTIARLVQEGYLQSTPKDPGDLSPDSEKNYVEVPQGNGIACLRHGVAGIYRTGPVAEQLRASGVIDPEILQRARGFDEARARMQYERSLPAILRKTAGPWLEVLAVFFFLGINSRRMVHECHLWGSLLTS